MIEKKKFSQKRKGMIAIFQIALLIISLVSFSYMFGSNLPLVSAQRGFSGSFVKTSVKEAVKSPTVAPIPVKSAQDIFKSAFGIGKVGSSPDNPILDASPVPPGTPVELDLRPEWLQRLSGAIKWDLLLNMGIAAATAFAITFLYVGITTGNWERAAQAATRTGISTGIGYGAGTIAVAVVGGPATLIIAGSIFLFNLIGSLFSKETDRTVIFQCKQWQPPTGGDNCIKCNDGPFPCREYECKSLGTACEMVNKDSDDPKCIWNNSADVRAPTIKPWEDALSEGYNYDPLPAGRFGVEIKYGNQECLPPFQPFTFGVELDKLGWCKIDSNVTVEDFMDMEEDFGGSDDYLIHHKEGFSFFGAEQLEKEGIPLTNNGEFEFFVRCESVNGVSNREAYLFKFCIGKEKDNTVPTIWGFNWADNAPISFFAENEPHQVNVQAYVNKPSQCKWDHEDKDYDKMENSLKCPTSLRESIIFKGQLSYACTGNLTGLENDKKNDFFFRCNDTLGNFNKESKQLTLTGTQSLYIKSISPNDTIIKGASTSQIKVALKVETSAGASSGESTCYYREGESGQFNEFTKTRSYTHLENRYLDPGVYNYYVRCIDSAGNSDTKQVSFTVESDSLAPIVVRAFHDGNYLKIITNEEAQCVYDTVDCGYDFDDGINMTTTDKKEHFTTWNTLLNFYIKCEDIYGNEPASNQCNIVARPFNL